jgi:hypothetical protein
VFLSSPPANEFDPDAGGVIGFGLSTVTCLGVVVGAVAGWPD